MFACTFSSGRTFYYHLFLTTTADTPYYPYTLFWVPQGFWVSEEHLFRFRKCSHAQLGKKPLMDVGSEGSALLTSGIRSRHRHLRMWMSIWLSVQFLFRLWIICSTHFDFVVAVSTSFGNIVPLKVTYFMGQCTQHGNLLLVEEFSGFSNIGTTGVYTLSESWSGVNWEDLMAAQGVFGTDIYDR